MTQQEPTSPYLRQEPRTSERAALDVAIRGLRIIARPVTGESDMERAMRVAAEAALRRIETLAPGSAK